MSKEQQFNTILQEAKNSFRKLVLNNELTMRTAFINDVLYKTEYTASSFRYEYVGTQPAEEVVINKINTSRLRVLFSIDQANQLPRTASEKEFSQFASNIHNILASELHDLLIFLISNEKLLLDQQFIVTMSTEVVGVFATLFKQLDLKDKQLNLVTLGQIQELFFEFFKYVYLKSMATLFQKKSQENEGETSWQKVWLWEQFSIYLDHVQNLFAVFCKVIDEEVEEEIEKEVHIFFRIFAYHVLEKGHAFSIDLLVQLGEYEDRNRDFKLNFAKALRKAIENRPKSEWENFFWSYSSKIPTFFEAYCAGQLSLEVVGGTNNQFRFTTIEQLIPDTSEIIIALLQKKQVAEAKHLVVILETNINWLKTYILANVGETEDISAQAARLIGSAEKKIEIFKILLFGTQPEQSEQEEKDEDKALLSENQLALQQLRASSLEKTITQAFFAASNKYVNSKERRRIETLLDFFVIIMAGRSETEFESFAYLQSLSHWQESFITATKKLADFYSQLAAHDLDIEQALQLLNIDLDDREQSDTNGFLKDYLQLKGIEPFYGVLDNEYLLLRMIKISIPYIFENSDSDSLQKILSFLFLIKREPQLAEILFFESDAPF